MNNMKQNIEETLLLKNLFNKRQTTFNDFDLQFMNYQSYSSIERIEQNTTLSSRWIQLGLC